MFNALAMVASLGSLSLVYTKTMNTDCLIIMAGIWRETVVSCWVCFVTACLGGQLGK